MKINSSLYLVIIAALSAVLLYYSSIVKDADSLAARYFGVAAFLLVCASLAISPLAKLWPKHFLSMIPERRAVGLAAFVLSLMHMIVVMRLLGWDYGFLFQDIGLATGSIAFVVMVVLAATSTDLAMRVLTPRVWKIVQSANYLVYLASFYHFLLMAKGPAVIGQYNFAEACVIAWGVAVLLLRAYGLIMGRCVGKEKAAG